MAYDYFDLVNKAQLWAQRAHASGWISSDEARQFSAIDTRTPTALFNDNEARPLLVAFMGGTGVGKSSLLNRLAGKAIARTGVQRPTSHEVTLFHHHCVTLKQLPGNLPVTSAKIAQHDDESKKNIVWIDMPDIDSIERNNRLLVLTWLPHIDILVYVVSPERYRDDKEWRLLLAEGSRHAWLFAFNQWDKGCPEQFQDFQNQLHQAGFIEPIIFKTACANYDAAVDEFGLLEKTLTSLATEHTVKQLEQRGLQVKTGELRTQLQRCAQSLGTEQGLQQAIQLWREQWTKTAHQLQQGFAWPLKQLAAYHAEHAADLVSVNTSPYSLWDAWAQTRFDDALDEFTAGAGQLGIPAIPLKKQLYILHNKAPKIIQTNKELAVRESLANPGNLLQRNFLKIVRLCEIFLPLLSICWVGYQLFIGYYTSAQTNTHYLGLDFAVHSTLLIAISWLTPFFILKKLKPSLEKSALRGLNKGVTLALIEIDSAVANVIKEAGAQLESQRTQLMQIIEQCGAAESPHYPPMANDSVLTRMLVDESALSALSNN